MANLDDAIAAMEENTTVEASLVTLTSSIKSMLDDALAGTTLPPAVQAKVDALFNGLKANSATAAAAIVANTPSAPPAP